MKNNARKKILIVEDEVEVAEILERKLSKEHYEVIRAGNGFEGLKKSVQEKPDLILLDIVMPKMDGITMLKKLREEPSGKKIPVIILTNLTSDPDRLAKTGEYGTADYLVKADWNINDLINKIKMTLNQKG